MRGEVGVEEKIYLRAKVVPAVALRTLPYLSLLKEEEELEKKNKNKKKNKRKKRKEKKQKKR